MAEHACKHVHKQTRGWLLPYLLGLDSLPGVGSGRWAYWMQICDTLELPAEPIPYIDFAPKPDEGWRSPYPDRMKETPSKHIKRVLELYVYKGYWYDDAWLAFVRWLLHGFGRRGLEDDVERIPEDVRDKWYTEFNLAYLLAVPADWSAWLLQGGPRWMKQKGARWTKSWAFFGTPMDVGEMMTRMLFLGDDDARLKTVCDPCCGTGSLLLLASNHSLRLYGQDIVHDLCLCAELNGWLYAPWLAFIPPLVSTMFEMRTQRAVPLLPPIHLETDPARVEATRAYRAGELGQADFFGQVGVSTIEEQRIAYNVPELEPALA